MWQQRFKDFELNENDFIYVDERLLFPEELRKPIFCSLHWGHPSRDAMLQAVVDIWWQNIHWDVVPLAQFSSQCQQGGKSLKTLIPRSKLGKLPAAENHNDHLGENQKYEIGEPLQNEERQRG